MGSKEFFEETYKKYYKVLYYFALRMVNNQLAAEDIVHDVFTDCWIKRNNIDITKSLKPYLYRLTYNRCIDYLRLSVNRNVHISDSAFSLENLLYTSYLQDEHFDAIEIEKEIENCINALPVRCREIFMLSRYDDLKNKEIAQKLGINIKSVEKQISKALQQIRATLQQLNFFF